MTPRISGICQRGAEARSLIASPPRAGPQTLTVAIVILDMHLSAGCLFLVGARQRATASALYAFEWPEPFGEPGSHGALVEFSGGDGEHEINGVVSGDLEPVSVEDAKHGE